MTDFSYSAPLAITEAELQDIETLARRMGLDEIAKVCTELRVLRRHFLELSRQVVMYRKLQPPPPVQFPMEANVRWAADLNSMTGSPNAPKEP